MLIIPQCDYLWPHMRGLSAAQLIILHNLDNSQIHTCTKIICTTGDLYLNYEQLLKTMDMPSIKDLSEVCHKHFYRIFRSDKYPLFSRLTLNHRVSSRRQFRQSRCRITKRQKAFFQTQMRHSN